jgi:hypothetical protein
MAQANPTAAQEGEEIWELCLHIYRWEERPEGFHTVLLSHPDRDLVRSIGMPIVREVLNAFHPSWVVTHWSNPPLHGDLKDSARLMIRKRSTAVPKVKEEDAVGVKEEEGEGYIKKEQGEVYIKKEEGEVYIKKEEE